MAVDILPGKKREQYLERLRERTPPGVAAREFGLTGSLVRSVCRRDPEFARQFEEAWDEGVNHYKETLAAAARIRAIDEGSDRIMEVELATHGGPEYAHLRRDRMRVDQHVEGAVVVALTPDLLATLPEEHLAVLEAVLTRSTGEVAEIPETT